MSGKVPPLLLPRQRGIGYDFKKYDAVATIYGDKAAGLCVLPSAWTPDFLGVPVDTHRTWQKTRKVEFVSHTAELTAWLEQVPKGARVLLRSSGVGEALKDRGTLLTIVLKTNDVSGLKDAALKIFEHAASVLPHRPIGLILHRVAEIEASGQFSNETSVTPTRNQWKYEVEQPTWSPPQGLNSKRASLPDNKAPLRGRSTTPQHALRSLGQWINASIGPRCHVEWVIGDGKLWVVQVDLEWREKDTGIDPERVSAAKTLKAPDASSSKIFSLYQLGTETASKKLANVNDFDFSADRPPPNLFYLSGAEAAAALRNNADALALEIDRLTSGKCVIRTDIIGQSTFNLPRTDTLDGRKATDWLKLQLEDFSRKGLEDLDSVLFVMHSFLPSLSAAWVYADPTDPLVLVDSLWGLPDGLQFLPHDSYQVDRIRENIVARKIRYKPRFLMENADGSWRYEDVLVSKARRTSLESKDVLDIALRTSKIAQKIGGAAQIMWFCGIPDSYGHGRNIPWFRARDLADPPPRHELRYKPAVVHTPDDLQKLVGGPYTLSLMPDASLVRNEEFLDAVIEYARTSRAAVTLQGSLLGHTFYKLSAAGIAVILHDPVQHYRKRGRKTFGKLVRDKIPAGIASKGEIVREAVLNPRDMITGLAAKLCEESVELVAARNDEDRAEELSDINELVSALSRILGLSAGEVADRTDRKRAKRGGFAERRVLLETSLPMPGLASTSLPEVSLSDIAHVILKEGTAFVPFAAVFANPDGLTIDLEALKSTNRIRIRLAPGGLRLEAVAETQAGAETQLDMFQRSAKIK